MRAEGAAVAVQPNSKYLTAFEIRRKTVFRVARIAVVTSVATILCVLIVRLAEELVYFIAAGGAVADFGDHFADQFPLARFLSIQLWLMVLFLAYVTTLA
jgi:hypothetical protein